MKDMRKTRKGSNKDLFKPQNQNFTEVNECEELNRHCKPKPNHEHECKKSHHDHECKKMHCECECEYECKPSCEPCKIDAEDCIDNVSCGPKCCSPISTQKFSTANCVPYLIEANRIYDTMQFQTFTDAVGCDGEPLCFEYEVVEVKGPVPRSGQVNVTIDKVCLNYSEITIYPGVPSLEDYDIQTITKVKPCETTFDYAVCLEKNSECCKHGKGHKAVYKQKGLAVVVDDLVLELRGKCGCTEIVALAYPVNSQCGGQKRVYDKVEFIFNTLSAPLCLPSDGRSITLRQDFQVNLTVDCIGKALLKHADRDCCDDCCGHDGHYKLCIPGDIDLICCLQEIVSVLTSEQIAVLGSQLAVTPRVVDTFAKTCDFSGCGDIDHHCNKKGHCGC